MANLKCAECPYWSSTSGGEVGSGCHFRSMGAWDQAPCEIDERGYEEELERMDNNMANSNKQFTCDFFDDYEKMWDFFTISKEEFLASYSYLNEIEYDATAEKVKNLKVLVDITDEDWTNYCALMENWEHTDIDALFIGSIHVGSVCFDITARQTCDPTLPKFTLDVDSYLLGIETGYGYLRENDMPYDNYGNDSFESLYIDKSKDDFVKEALPFMLRSIVHPYRPVGYNEEVLPLLLTLNETFLW